MGTSYLIDFLEKKHVSTVKKAKHTYLTYHGLEEGYTYVLKEGIVKTSMILKDGREFNLSYINTTDIISLLRDEISAYTASPLNVRIESEDAIFYRIPRKTFWGYVNSDANLQDYVKDYYRIKLTQNIKSLQWMTMNGKKGAVCAFIYKLISIFGNHGATGILIDFPITNEDIANFCGISTRNSVNRIIHSLKEDKIIDIKNQRIFIYDVSYLQSFTI
ncbi:Crp/Fnr family transcriptional regulator [Pediococcus claussenii]|uniref:Transcription regulator, Crp family n=1 Tax=Pediococcus claussenii (strain ATCC BAA-344 / DSM 14800 / JCM 18046 / KCTC 3811 / LMG 21948 / P06) TaxID=701521 RepID=G8PBT9_PEDCP|nr:Crp/Fnr family transcriptional regulator [Pediococcus claussenii]AEV95997.1 Transcription regulator, Crp family [Pediococcus claussenii ATCC BAA-344]ANZ69483.1 Crp/Fnr family transcriptional regulator [Pediococcus claussenii]ANZ71302.1 Crp/Fnr family transcriptional regulator [Pediococcus claussenii]KRN20603.1 hypothetical protein IV79_GL000662 [Pediococcus claussenii]